MIVTENITTVIQKEIVYCDFCATDKRKVAVNGSRGCNGCGRHVCELHSTRVSLPGSFSPDDSVPLCLTCYSISLTWFDKWRDENKRHEGEVDEIEAGWRKRCHDAAGVPTP